MNKKTVKNREWKKERVDEWKQENKEINAHVGEVN
jgi:post-segregation antitoxin (ccd killing protein)